MWSVYYFIFFVMYIGSLCMIWLYVFICYTVLSFFFVYFYLFFSRKELNRWCIIYLLYYMEYSNCINVVSNVYDLIKDSMWKYFQRVYNYFAARGRLKERKLVGIKSLKCWSVLVGEQLPVLDYRHRVTKGWNCS